MTKHSYVAKFKRKDETVFTKRFLASDLFEAVEHALEYATKRDILYLDLGHAGQQSVESRGWDKKFSVTKKLEISNCGTLAFNFDSFSYCILEDYWP